MTRKKTLNEPKPPKINPRDWRNLPTPAWNTLSLLAFTADMNREKYGVEEYVPFRNWAVERGMVKTALERYGPEVMRKVFTQAFAEYRPSRDYPILTAGFVISYVMSRLLPRILAEKAERERMEAEQACGEVVQVTGSIAW